MMAARVRLVLLASALMLVQTMPASASSDERLAQKVVAEMRIAGGSSGAWVADAASGESIVAVSPDVRRTPASVQKLLTTATALERFGERQRLETEVRAAGELTPDGVLDGGLYLHGSGDPSFDTADLAHLAARIRTSGLELVSGRVYGDESYFDGRRGLPAGNFLMSVDIGPLSALSFNSGTLSGFGRGFQLSPPRFVAERLKAALARRGVEIERGARAGRAPPSAEPLAVVRSPTIAALVRHTNLISDNYYAEILLKGLGARFGAAGSTNAGAAVVRRFQQTLGVGASILDGSGLSRGDAISARSVGRLLVSARREPWFSAFYRSLPLAARTGTLRKRMHATAAAGRCRAKTGTLRGVSALAGYCRSRARRSFAFALLMNGVDVERARQAQDRIAAALAGYSG